MDLVYQAIHAALLPVRLDELPQYLGVFLEHIGHRNERLRPKHIAIFQAELQPQPLRGTHLVARAA